MKPLLAHIYEPHRVTFPCYVQPKLNGIRALFQNGFFQSRDEEPFPVGLLQHLSQPLLDLFGSQVILDGELYKHGWPLQRINGAVTPIRQEPNEDTLQIEYHVFDVVDFNKSFSERFQTVRSLIHFKNGLSPIPIKAVLTGIAKDEASTNLEYANFVSQDYEGMILRLGDCPYTVPKQPKEGHWVGNTNGYVGPNSSKFLSDQDNRTWSLLKRKSWQDAEFVCTGVVEGEGKYRNSLGALICYPIDREGLVTGEKFSVSSGLTDAERAAYWDTPPINRLIKVRYLCLSSSGIPLNPSILAIL